MIFLAVDPVAADSVMYDYLAQEATLLNDQIHEAGDDYLYLAAQAGLGVFEHWNNDQDKQYTTIDYLHIDLDQQTCTDQCLEQSCDNYLNCSSASGGCSSGFCCQGSCDTPSTCLLPDLDCDQDIDVIDLQELINAWGTNLADFNNDNITNTQDLGIMMSTWGDY